jgi:hypothetical protein
MKTIIFDLRGNILLKKFSKVLLLILPLLLLTTILNTFKIIHHHPLFILSIFGIFLLGLTLENLTSLDPYFNKKDIRSVNKYLFVLATFLIFIGIIITK